MVGFLLPALVAGLVIYAAFDIYTHQKDGRKSKRKNDEFYEDDL